MRHRLLTALASFALLGPASSHTAFAAEAASAQSPAPAVFRLPLGDLEVIALFDGAVTIPMDKVVSNPERARKLLAKTGKTLTLSLSTNGYVIKAGGRYILVDTGTGKLFGADRGHLVRSLQAAGIAPNQIDAVLLTHMHVDHGGGLVANGAMVFPNATVYVDKRDADHWLNAEAEKAVAAGDYNGYRYARISTEPYVKAGKLKTFSGAAELFPGIRAVPTYGHTPGHAAFMVESKGQRLLLWGDLLHVAEVQFPAPDITMDFDVDQTAALASRRRMLADAAEGGYLVGSAHLAFPGIGHVRKDGDGYRWVPVQATQASSTKAGR